MILDPNRDLSVVSLSILQQYCNFSSRAVTVCRINQLTNLGKIIDFYENYQSFSRLRGIGEKTDQELDLFCKHFYHNKLFYEKLAQEALLKQYCGDMHPDLMNLTTLQKNIISNYIRLKIKSLSLRVFHVITRNLAPEIYFDEFAQVFLKQKSNIAQIRNIGVKSLQELTLFMEDVEAFALKQTHLASTMIPPAGIVEREPIAPPLQLPDLSALKKQIVATYILRETKKLSKPVQDWMTSALNPPFTFDIFAETFLTTQSMSILKEVSYAQEELLLFIGKIRTQIQRYADIEDSQMPNYVFLNVLSQTFDLSPSDEALFIQAIEKKTFFLFSFFEYLVEHQHFMNQKQILIFKHRSPFSQHPTQLTLNEIGTLVQLKHERVRQLSVNLETKIAHWWSFLMDYSNDIQLFTHYKLRRKVDVIPITPSFIQSINQSEKTTLSPFFFNKTFSHLYHRTHALIGDTLEKFKSTYLIRKNLVEAFAFEPFFDTIYQQISDKLYEDLKLNMDELLYKFIQTQAIPLLASVRAACKKIILNEFIESVEFDLNNHIIFKRNVKTYEPEMVIAILQAHGSPMSIKHIYQVFNDKYNEMDPSYKKVRETIRRYNNLFILFGRHTYGLVEWEETQEKVKSGTIRDLVENYLNQFDEPKHISELTEYVLKYRPNTYLYSINTNLCCEPTQRFQEFKGGFWGLYSKKYENIEFKEAPAFFFKYTKMMIQTAANSEYETILTGLCEKFNLKRIQVQYLIEKNIEGGGLRRENNLLEIC